MYEEFVNGSSWVDSTINPFYTGT